MKSAFFNISPRWAVTGPAISKLIPPAYKTFTHQPSTRRAATVPARHKTEEQMLAALTHIQTGIIQSSIHLKSNFIYLLDLQNQNKMGQFSRLIAMHIRK
jgi:hypothetical protein